MSQTIKFGKVRLTRLDNHPCRTWASFSSSGARATVRVGIVKVGR